MFEIKEGQSLTDVVSDTADGIDAEFFAVTAQFEVLPLRIVDSAYDAEQDETMVETELVGVTHPSAVAQHLQWFKHSFLSSLENSSFVFREERSARQLAGELIDAKIKSLELQQCDLLKKRRRVCPQAVLVESTLMPLCGEPLTLPDSQAEVEGCVSAALTSRRLLRLQLKAAQAHLQMVQSMCEHPQDQQVQSKDIEGELFLHCRICGLDR